MWAEWKHFSEIPVLPQALCVSPCYEMPSPGCEHKIHLLVSSKTPRGLLFTLIYLILTRSCQESFFFSFYLNRLLSFLADIVAADCVIRVFKTQKFRKPWSYSKIKKKKSTVIRWYIVLKLSIFHRLSSQTIYLSEIYRMSLTETLRAQTLSPHIWLILQ